MLEYQPPALSLWGKYHPSFIVPDADAYQRDTVPGVRHPDALCLPLAGSTVPTFLF